MSSVGYNVYKNNEIMYASREKLLLLILDEAVKQGKMAKLYLEKKKYAEASKSLLKAEDIFVELISSLETSAIELDWINNMKAVYAYLYNSLVTVNVKKDIKLLDEIMPLIINIRDIWYEASKKSV